MSIHKSTYNSWSNMKQRCLNKNDAAYKNYGGRGITIASQWLKYSGFLADMGEKPVGLSIDRIDNDGNYEPGNCRWATRKEQNNNTRRNTLYEYNGVWHNLSEWCYLINIRPSTFIRRLRNGWTVERILSTPLLPSNKETMKALWLTRPDIWKYNANSVKTHCNLGHEFNDANTYWRIQNGNRTRNCITCKNVAMKKWYAKKANV